MDRVEQDDISQPLATLTEVEEHDEFPDDSSSQTRSVKRSASLPLSPGTSSTFGRHIPSNQTRKALNTVPNFAIPPLPVHDSSNTNDTPQTANTTTDTITMSTPTSRRKPTGGSIDEDSSVHDLSPLGQIQPKLSSTSNKKGALPKRSFSGDLVKANSFGARPKPGVRRSASLDADDVRNKPISDSPADRLSSIILPGSLGAKVSRRSQHFKNSIAQVSTNFFNRAQSDDEMQYVRDVNRQELYTKSESVFRAYSVGDAVFVFTNHRFVSSVNRFGFPPGEGRTAEEKTGPFIFVLGMIQEIHFEENSVFYTVRREDTGVDVRGSPGKYRTDTTIRSSDRERGH
jgi:hypothetical protein